MDSFSYCFIPSKRERYIRYTTTYFCQRHFLLDDFCSFNKIYCIVIVLFYTCSYCKNVGIKNNILRIKSYFFNQYLISSFTNFHLTILRISLSYFIKSHYNHCCSIGFANMRLFYKLFFSFFHGDRIHNTLSLYTF